MKRALLLLGVVLPGAALFCRTAVAQVEMVDPLAITDLLTGDSPEQRDQKAWKAWLETRVTPLAGEPTQAIAAVQQFLTEHPRLDPNVGVRVAVRLAELWNKGAKNPDKALETYQLAFDAYRVHPAAVDLLTQHAQLLLALKRPNEAEELLQDSAVAIRGGWGYLAFGALQAWVRALQEQNKDEQAIALMQSTLLEYPELWEVKGLQANGRFQEPLSQALLEGEKQSEALSWAKLRWMLSAYDAESIDLASRMLVKVWSGVEPDKSGLKGFAGAQKDASVANPLREVALPPLPVGAKPMGEMLQRWGGPQQTGYRVSLLLWAGAPREAMLEAQKLWESKNPAQSAQGALQVARVFKAVDLNLTRANAFLAFAKSKTGENSIDEFLRETAPNDAGKVAGGGAR